SVDIDYFFGGPRSMERGPQVFLVHCFPGYLIKPHFHRVDQYQVFVRGRARIGKHEVRPVYLHYTDAYTPYGPITFDDSEPASMFTIRGRPDPGANYMPESRDQLKGRAGRTIVAQTRSELRPSSEQLVEEILIEPQEDGLAAYARLAAPGASIEAE